MRSFGTTIFAEMSALALTTGSINLGQGFPDTDGPAAMLDVAADGLRGGLNQYPPGPGMPALRAAIAAHQLRRYGLSYDPDSEVLVTVGATEAVSATILALCEPGDEVVVLRAVLRLVRRGDCPGRCAAGAGRASPDGGGRPVLLRPG